MREPEEDVLYVAPPATGLRSIPSGGRVDHGKRRGRLTNDGCYAMNAIASTLQSFFHNQLAKRGNAPDVVDVGTVISIGDGIARIYGCEACLAGELLEFADGTLGLALNLESQTVGAVRFAKPMGDNSTCVEGSIVRTTRSVANIPVGPGYRGRIVNALGSPMDGLGAIESQDQERRSLESPAPSILDRRSVHEPFATGITAIDAMIPIGRGQRELIIGDRQTGKTTVAVDAILNQTDVLCVYVAVGQKNSTVAEMLAATCTVYDDLTFHLGWIVAFASISAST